MFPLENQHWAVDLLHPKKKFKLNLAFSFKGADGNPGKVFEIETSASGTTRFDIDVTL